MAFTTESNRHAVGAAPEQITTGVAGPSLGVLGRVFIDLGIAVVAIGGAFFTGGTSISLLGFEAVSVPTIIGVTASATSLITNTSIDVAEGNTDALTLGLDIGLPFATEALGAVVGAVVKSIPLAEDTIVRLARNNNLFTDASQRNIKELIQFNKEASQRLLNTDAQIFGESSLRESLKIAESNVAALEQSFRSLTDIFDKVTGTLREFIARLLPRISGVLSKVKSWTTQFRKVISTLLNPVNLFKTKVETQVKAIVKKAVPAMEGMKSKLKTIYQRCEVRKQSILQNALINKYNIEKVMSSWVLGTSLVINETDEDGSIKDAHLIWWFIPEQTKHNGERGATPEPMGKRPVGMLNINQAQYDFIMSEASFGRFYLDNVAGGKASTNLFGSSGINLSDLQDNFINKLFKNALHIIPGYSLFVDVKQSIDSFQKLADNVVSGEWGRGIAKDITNYRKYTAEYGTKLIPSKFRSSMTTVYNNGKFDGSERLLRSAESKLTSKMENVTKDGKVMKVKNY